MRWQRLFADLDAQVEAAADDEQAAEVVDRTRREQARVRLRDRLAAHRGSTIEVHVVGAGRIRGAVDVVGADWFAVHTVGGDVLVAAQAVLTVRGLGRRARVPEREGAVESRRTLAHALRVLMRDRATVRVDLRDGGHLAGLVERVGADFVDVAPRWRDSPADGDREALLVPFAALACVRIEP